MPKIADVLSDLDPPNALRYRKNAEQLNQRINVLLKDVERDLRPLRKVPYIVFHDAYQYFEHRFTTNAMGAISVDPEHPPGAKRLYEVRKRIVASKVRCVFREPQFEPNLPIASPKEHSPRSKLSSLSAPRCRRDQTRTFT